LWKLEVNPGGQGDKPGESTLKKDMVAVFLHYGGLSSVPVKTEFKIRIVNQIEGKQDITLPRRNIECARFACKFDVSNGVVSSRGFPSFVYQNVLNDECNGYKVDDCVVLEADITTFGGALTSFVTAGAPTTFKAVRRQLFPPEPALAATLTESFSQDKRASSFNQDQKASSDNLLMDNIKAVNSMTVAALKSALAARGLEVTGLKFQLANRLKAAIWSSAGNSRLAALPVDN